MTKKTRSTSSHRKTEPVQAKVLNPISAPLSELVDTYAAAAQSGATTHSYNADSQHFKSYGGTIPATAEMIAEYLTACAGTTAVATLQHRLIAIHRAHIDQNIPSPVMDRIVTRTMQGIRRTFQSASVNWLCRSVSPFGTGGVAMRRHYRI